MCALVFSILVTGIIVIASGVRQTRRWEDENGITARREAHLAKVVEFMRRTGFERRPDESLDDAARRLRRLTEGL